MAKLLIHTCCGPCFLGTYEGIKDQGFEIYNFFYNPNVWPKEEYQRRLENLKKAATGKSKDIVVGEYEPGEHATAIKGRENDFPKRCLNCYRLRLTKTAKKAKEEGFDLFSTTLLVSPFQQHEDLKKIGKEIAQKEGIEFYYQDLRPFFREGQNLAKEKGIYRQKYCGCVYSKEYK